MNIDIYDKLRERILFLEYEPGQIFKELDLAERFKVSRTPLRTVLSRLEWEHLVKILPRTGVLITELELNRITDVFQARLEVEEVIGRLAAERFMPGDLSGFEKMVKDCDRLLDNKDPRALAAIDGRLKSWFSRAAANQYLTEVSERLYTLTFRLWYFNMLRMNAQEWHHEVMSVREEIRELAELLGENSPERVGSVLKTHLTKHTARLRENFLGFSIYR